LASQRISGILGKKDAGGDARAFLGVFGKHPGWNDHIDDIGLETERLVQIKRELYVEGIGGNIDAGAWDAIAEDGRLTGFDHLFLWRAGGETAVGRFWSSSDGKGRTRYPMVVCAQVRGQPMSWQVRYVAPLLERLQDDFKAADTAEKVVARAENARREIEALASGERGATDVYERSATAALAADPAMGPEKRGMYRLLYQMERELAAFLRGGLTDGTRTRVADLTPRHLRVPRCLRDEGQSMLLWWRFVTEHIGDGAPVVLMSPRGQDFIDILVGEAGVSQFTCVRAAEKTIPLTTEIPYSFDEAFVRRAEERIAGTPAEVKPDAGTKRIAAAGGGGGLAAKIKGNGRKMEPKQIAMIAGLAVLGVIVVGGAILLLSGGGGAAKNGGQRNRGGGGGTNGGGTPGGSTSTNGSRPIGEGATANPNFGTAQRADFADWCTQAEWALELRDRLAGADLTRLSGDQHLSQKVAPLLEALRSPDMVIDPRRVASGGPRQLAALGGAPPASAQTDEAIARTGEALRVIRGIKSGIEPGAWPARATVRRSAMLAREAGWTSLAGALEGVSSGVSLPSAGGIATLEAVTRAAGPAARLESAWSAYESAHRALVEQQRAQPDLRLADLPDLLERVEAPADTGASPDRAIDAAGAAAGRLESIAGLTADVARAASDRWPALDVAYFLASSPLEAPASGVDENYFRAWIQEVRRDTYSLLDPEVDPRRGWDVEARLATLGRDVQGLRQAGGGIDPAEIDGLERQLATLRESFGIAAELEWNRAGRDAVVAAANEVERGVSGLEGGYDRLTGRLSEQWERETARLRDRDEVTGLTSPALTAAWIERRDELLGRFTTPDRLTALSQRVEELEGFLVGLERAVPHAQMPRERPSVLDADALERAMERERERAVSELLDSVEWSGEGFDQAGFEAAAGAAAAEFEQWAGRVTKATESMARVEGLLAAGYGTHEAAAGQTIEAFAQTASAEAVGEDVSVVFAPLTRQIEALAAVEGAADVDVLARAAGNPASPLGVSLAAWRGLGAGEWPATPVQLRTEADLARALTARCAGIDDAERRAAVTGEIAKAQAERWLAYAGRAQAGDDAAAIREVLGSRESFGVPVESLTGGLRFNAMVAEFAGKAGAASAGSREAELKALAGQFVADVDALDLGSGSLGSMQGWMTEVLNLASDAPAAAVLDPTTMGPGSMGWRGEEVENGQRVRFVSPDGGQTLEFVRLEAGDGGLTEPVYLCTTELPVGLMQWAAGQGGNLARLKSLTVVSPPGDSAGIKTWVFGARQGREGVVPAEGWFLAGEVAQGIQPWASGLTPGRPGLKTPVTQIPPAAAAAVAEWLGCRLPSGEEWLAGRARYETGNGGTPPVWNLRDRTWGEQLDHVRVIQRGGRLAVKFPDEGVFHPEGSAAKMEGQAQVLGTDDDALFLEDVDATRGRTLLQLVGNAAEYVTLGRAGGGEPPQFGVVGASALSAPEDYEALQGACVIPVETLEFGWSDVGIRLAFSAKADGAVAPLWRRMQRVGAAAPVLTGVAPGPG